MSSKTVTTWYYNEQSFIFKYCANIVFATHEIFQEFCRTNIYLITHWQEVKKFMQLLKLYRCYIYYVQIIV